MESNTDSMWIKAAMLAFLAEVGIPVEIFTILIWASALDIIAGATFYVKMGQFDLKKLAMGIWVKILLLGTVFWAAYAAKNAGYETASTISQGYILVKSIDDFFSAITHVRGIRAGKAFKQLDLLSIFFEFIKKMILEQFEKWKNERSPSKNSDEDRGEA